MVVKLKSPEDVKCPNDDKDYSYHVDLGIIWVCTDVFKAPVQGIAQNVDFRGHRGLIQRAINKKIPLKFEGCRFHEFFCDKLTIENNLEFINCIFDEMSVIKNSEFLKNLIVVNSMVLLKYIIIYLKGKRYLIA